jgi:hypothetical protein
MLKCARFAAAFTRAISAPTLLKDPQLRRALYIKRPDALPLAGYEKSLQMLSFLGSCPGFGSDLAGFFAMCGPGAHPRLACN